LAKHYTKLTHYKILSLNPDECVVISALSNELGLCLKKNELGLMDLTNVIGCVVEELILVKSDFR